MSEDGKTYWLRKVGPDGADWEEAERAAGFRPKSIPFSHPDYFSETATSSFSKRDSGGHGIEGKTENYVPSPSI